MGNLQRQVVTILLCIIACYNIYIRQKDGTLSVSQFQYHDYTIRQEDVLGTNSTDSRSRNSSWDRDDNGTSLNNYNMSNWPKCFVNLHLPKVGGRTIESFVYQISLHPKINHPRRYRLYGQRLNPQILRGRFLLVGHFTTRLLDLTPYLRECFVMTALREPVDRAISAFFFHGHTTDEIDRCLLHSRSSVTCKLYWQYSNDMTRYFAGMQNIPWNTYEISTGKSYALPVPTPNNTSLEDAKQKLDDYFDLVCFLDDLPTCAEQLLQIFPLGTGKGGVNMSNMTKNKDNTFRTAERPDALQDNDMKKFQDANAMDEELYQWAVSKFQHQPSHAMERWRQKMHRLRT